MFGFEVALGVERMVKAVGPGVLGGVGVMPLGFKPKSAS